MIIIYIKKETEMCVRYALSIQYSVEILSVIYIDEELLAS